MPYELIVRVTSDPGRGVEGALIAATGKYKGGKTGADGTARLTFHGGEGESLELTVKCPEGYRSPTKSVPVTLRHLENPTKRPEYSVTCQPLNRTLVVAVRADNGPNLPILSFGQEVGRTDASGAATVMMSVRPGEKVELKLDTEQGGKSVLRPDSPAQSFAVQQSDEVVSWRQSFVLPPEKKRAVVRWLRRPAAKAPAVVPVAGPNGGPVRIGAGSR